MPRPRRSFGRPGTRVIPEGWGEAHAPVVRGTFNAKCKIYAPTATPQAGDDLSYADPEDPGTPAYDGGCRVQAWAGEASTVLGEEYRGRSVYLVVVDYQAVAIADGALVDVHESNDPDLAGLHLTVRKPIAGSERFERDLFCVADRS